MCLSQPESFFSGEICARQSETRQELVAHSEYDCYYLYVHMRTAKGKIGQDARRSCCSIASMLEWTWSRSRASSSDACSTYPRALTQIWVYSEPRERSVWRRKRRRQKKEVQKKKEGEKEEDERRRKKKKKKERRRRKKNEKERRRRKKKKKEEKKKKKKEEERRRKKKKKEVGEEGKKKKK